MAREDTVHLDYGTGKGIGDPTVAAAGFVVPNLYLASNHALTFQVWADGKQHVFAGAEHFVLAVDYRARTAAGNLIYSDGAPGVDDGDWDLDGMGNGELLLDLLPAGTCIEDELAGRKALRAVAELWAWPGGLEADKLLVASFAVNLVNTRASKKCD